MKTEKHPFSKVIHYATGGLITPNEARFDTMCGRKFKQGHSEIMDSGYIGAQRVTCKKCRKILDKNPNQEKIDKIAKQVREYQWDGEDYIQKSKDIAEIIIGLLK